jgi:hypothetical protein
MVSFLGKLAINDVNAADGLSELSVPTTLDYSES